MATVVTLCPNGVHVHPDRERRSATSPNAVHTARFTPLTWLPKSLYLQFQRIANVYFAAVALLACTPLWGQRWKTKIGMLVLVLSAQSLKDLFEDLKRKWEDDRENSRKAVRVRANCLCDVPWERLNVGDLVIVRKGESFPCDLLVVSTSDLTGTFYVSTKSLDGETNLKERRAPPGVQEWLRLPADADPCIVGQRLSEGLRVELDSPNSSLDHVSGSVLCGTGRARGVDASNFALRGCDLQNTSWILGLACYVGKNTKVRLNSSPPPSKRSELERLLNGCVLYLLSFILCMGLYFTVASELRGDIDNKLLFYEVFVKYLIVLYPVLPMTLYVSFEVMHLVIGWQIERDPLMCDRATNEFALARNTSVIEEQGQVNFLFSDKTGTLTINEMRFAYCCVGEEILGPFLPEACTERRGGAGLGYVREQLRRDDMGLPVGARAFFESLAVCHTVKLDEDGSYRGESPDEVALVGAAADVGVKMTGRRLVDDGLVHSVTSDRGTTEHLIAHVLAFTSERKRMSVVCPRAGGAEGAVVITKGADNVMEPLLASPGFPAAGRRALGSFARQGLRTLVVARRELSAAEYRDWRGRWEAAGAAVEGREGLLAEAAVAVEADLGYLGVTALEDRLQEQVSETIGTMRTAGIRVWVLTGDKVETAVEIARACGLFEAGMVTFSLFGSAGARAARSALDEAVARAMTLSETCGIVLDGQAVNYFLDSPDTRAALYRLAVNCSACVCCRLSPRQKRELVELVREQDPQAITLAIGDGANDVPMIQGAHVGVGIRGKEGAAAVQACDMAISKFRFLSNLLFCHGRRSYRRISVLLLFFIYKSVVLGWCYIIYAHTAKFSGKLAFPEWLDMSYNMLTTGGVVMVMALDFDLKDEDAIACPLLYTDGLERRHFNPRVFAEWMFHATMHGTVAWCVPLYSLCTHNQRSMQTAEFWTVSYTAFASIILITHTKLVLSAGRRITCLGCGVVFLEVCAFVAVSLLLGTERPFGGKISPELVGVPQLVVTTEKYLRCIAMVPCLAFSGELLALCARVCRCACARREAGVLLPLARAASSFLKSTPSNTATFRGGSPPPAVELSSDPFVRGFSRESAKRSQELALI